MEETSWFEGADQGIHVRAALAAPLHEVPVTDELAVPVARSRLLVTVTVHEMACPPTLSTPLHWLIPGALTANAVPFSGPTAMTTSTTSANAMSPMRTLDGPVLPLLGSEALNIVLGGAEIARAFITGLLGRGHPDERAVKALSRACRGSQI
jgi:hypothetical protein